jgi:hypothetical protein
MFPLALLLTQILLASASSHAPCGRTETATDVPCLSTWTGPPNGPSIEEITSHWPHMPFRKLGGFSPWFDTDGVYGIQKSSLPGECTVDQVQIHMRHSMREASGGTHASLVALAKKLQSAKYEVTDHALAFVKTWNWTQPAEVGLSDVAISQSLMYSHHSCSRPWAPLQRSRAARLSCGQRPPLELLAHSLHQYLAESIRTSSQPTPTSTTPARPKSPSARPTRSASMRQRRRLRGVCSART